MAYNILIVEDEQAISRVLDLKLKQAGIVTTVANTGSKALELVKTQNYDCILLDLILPEVDGFTILEVIKVKNQATKVIVMTNLGQPEDRKRVQDLGALAYYVKSEMSIANLIENIKQILET
jgi:DNA-binding response OmpR family regulator